MERFLRLADFIGFGEHEVRPVRESRNLLSPLAPAIVAAVYDHLLRYPETARFFTDAAGRSDEVFLAKRKGPSLSGWRSPWTCAWTPPSPSTSTGWGWPTVALASPLNT